MSIPKIIHQTWKNKKIPDDWLISKQRWEEFHPGWEYRLWTDRDNREYIKINYPNFLEIFDSYPHNIQRADVIRYFILRDFGGVYSDLDIEPLGPIDKYVDHIASNGGVGLVFSGNVNVFTNSFMISAPRNPIWNKVIERLYRQEIPWWAMTKHFEVMYSTGPLMLNAVANEYRGPICLLPRPVFMAYSIADDRDSIKKGALLRPLKGGSWNSWDSHVLNFMYQHYIKIIAFIILLIIYVFKTKGFNIQSFW